MNYQRFAFPTFAFAVLAAALSMSSSCADQPPVKCTASATAAAARFKLVSMTGDCSMTPLVQNGGEIVGVQTFVPSVSDPNTYTLPNSVALQSDEASGLRDNGESVDPQVVDTDMTHHLYALGKFDDAFPDGNDVCHISTMSKAELNLPVVPAHLDADMMMVDEQPATHITYEWSNVRIVVKATSIGAETFAHLKYTRDMCTAEFDVSILTPAVGCDDGNGMPDQSKCDAPTDPAVPSVPPGTTTCEHQGENILCLPNKTGP